MKDIRHQMTILSNEPIAVETWLMVVLAQDLEWPVKAGTFFNLTVPGGAFLLQRPISVFSADPLKQQISFIYKIMGEGTRALSLLRAGGPLCAVGPLGQGFPIQDESQKVLLIGGGVGIPPLYELGCRLSASGRQITSVLGFKERGSVFCEAQFRSLGEVIICTDDGSYGFGGLVTQAVKEYDIDFDTVYACGPRPMLKAVDIAYRDSKKGWLSFEERMACGIGACYGCMTETKQGLKRVCKDGPVFALGEALYHD